MIRGMRYSLPRDAGTYAVILVHADGKQVVFESDVSKERAESMRDILCGFISDVRVVDQALPANGERLVADPDDNA